MRKKVELLEKTISNNTEDEMDTDVVWGHVGILTGDNTMEGDQKYRDLSEKSLVGAIDRDEYYRIKSQEKPINASLSQRQDAVRRTGRKIS